MNVRILTPTEQKVAVQRKAKYRPGVGSVAAHVLVGGSLPRVHHGIRAPGYNELLERVKDGRKDLVLRA